MPGSDRLEKVTSPPQIQCINFAAQLAIAVVSNMAVYAPYDPASDTVGAYHRRERANVLVSPLLNRRIAPVDCPVDVS